MRGDAVLYYIVWAIVLILASIEHLKKKPFNDAIVSVVIIVAAFLVACRVEVGADWSNYKFIFYNGYDSTGRAESSLEPLFLLCRTVFFSFGFTHAVFFLFLSLASLFAIRKASNLLGIRYFMTVLLVYYSMFFLNYQFNIVRHGLMASFVWLSFAYKSRGEVLAAIISILVAVGFHITALIYVPFLFFLDKRIPKLVVFIILASSYLSFYLRVSSRIIGLFPFLFELERTATFVTNEKFMESYGLTLGSQIQVVLFLFLYFRFPGSYKWNTGFRVLLNSLLFGFMLLCVLNAFHAIISRICNALFMAMIFLLPLFLEKYKKPKNRLIIGALICFYLFISLPKTFAIQEGGHSEMLPYKMEIRQLIDRSA